MYKMFNNKKLDEIFEELAEKTKDCKDIREFQEIANTFVAQAIGIHQEVIKNDVKAKAKLFSGIIERLKLCIPNDLPYYPVRVLILDKNKLHFGFLRKGVKLSFSV